MISVSYMMQCDNCTNLLPGIDEYWLSCKFSTETAMYNQARRLGWDFDPDNPIKCRSCKRGS